VVGLVAAACAGTPAASAPASASTSPVPTDVERAFRRGIAERIGQRVRRGVAKRRRERRHDRPESRSPDHKFAVTLPDGWTRIPLEAQDIDALIEAAGAQNPQLAAVLHAADQGDGRPGSRALRVRSGT
jgi:hypothetical protein